jgi:hypothetical protein
MAETTFCLSNEQREHIYSNLRGFDHVRTVLSRQDFALKRYAAELKNYTESIARLLDGPPRDLRCQERHGFNA